MNEFFARIFFSLKYLKLWKKLQSQHFAHLGFSFIEMSFSRATVKSKFESFIMKRESLQVVREINDKNFNFHQKNQGGKISCVAYFDRLLT
jgi:hypothetical protein